MSAVDDLSELVERAGAAERAALSSKWKERPEVDALRSRVGRVLAEHRAAERRSTGGDGLDPRRAALREAFLEGSDLDGPAVDSTGLDGADPPADGSSESAGPVSHDDAARAERDAVAAVGVARLALLEAHLAVLDARLARIDAGEDEPGAAAVDGHLPLQGRNAVSRHGPALAHGLRGEIAYILRRRPRTAVKSLAVSLALGLLYLGFIRVFEWDRDQRWLPYLGLWVISVMLGGAVCINAMCFDALRVRAALEGGSRLWHLLVIKNLAVAALIAPIGFLLSGLLAWRAGDAGAIVKACALVVCFILLWLGVGNVLSVLLPVRDEPILRRKQSGSLKQFAIAFVVAYAIGYLVNLMLLWRILAAQGLAQRLGGWVIPILLIVLSSLAMWFLLTVFAVALSQQPKIRRALLREIAEQTANAEARPAAEARQAA
ncbi:hypothetical protein GCM10010472_37580 [Pseudonocardia halophobica]|uniref:Uncharacterized protein n=1 Tax=Pseudonocardia halophobica TaxID=29401 RepID=A0A9W6NYP1_9PSEU|nr:hypothetical protein [Pseudonocardia halophobica]GLL14084.1 hypothetical protein GCM10017577_52300 [Pseudonocardia halophobica]